MVQATGSSNLPLSAKFWIRILGKPRFFRSGEDLKFLARADMVPTHPTTISVRLCARICLCGHYISETTVTHSGRARFGPDCPPGRPRGPATLERVTFVDGLPPSGPPGQRATYQSLINQFRPGRLLSISGIGNRDAYNPHFIRNRGRWVLAARVEPRESDWKKPETWHPQVMFFARSQGQWQPLRGAPIFENHEDPYATWITDSSGRRQLLFAAVTLDRTEPGDPIPVTRFYLAPSVQELDCRQPVAELHNLKDGFRVLQDIDGSLLMSTRPADGRVGENVLGLLRLQSIEEASAERVASDSISIPTGLDDGTFLAVNEMHWVRHKPSGERHIGVLGCISQPDAAGKWSFAAATWFIDPIRNVMTRPEVISERSAFPVAEPKADHLANVIFPGSLVRVGTASRVVLLTGVSDAYVGEVALDDPLERRGYSRVSSVAVA